MVKIPEDFLGKRLRKGQVFEIVGEGVLMENKLVIPVKDVETGEEVNISLYKIALTRLAAQLGLETKNWIGKRIVYDVETRQIAGNKREVAVFKYVPEDTDK